MIVDAVGARCEAGGRNENGFWSSLNCVKQRGLDSVGRGKDENYPENKYMINLTQEHFTLLPTLELF